MMRPLGGVERRLMRGLIGLLSVWQWRLYRWQDWAEQRITTAQPAARESAQDGAMPPPEASQDGGPPAHWAALVRRRAPWLLSRPPLRGPQPRAVVPAPSAAEPHGVAEVRDGVVCPPAAAAPCQRTASPPLESPGPDAPRANESGSLPGEVRIAPGSEERGTPDMPPPDRMAHDDAGVSARPWPGRISVVREAPAANQTPQAPVGMPEHLRPGAVAGDGGRMPPLTRAGIGATHGTERRPVEASRHEVQPGGSAVAKRGRSPGPDHRRGDARQAPQGFTPSVDPGHRQGVVPDVDRDPVAGVAPRRAPRQRTDVRRDEPGDAPFPLPLASSPRTNRPEEAPAPTAAIWPSLPEEDNEGAEPDRWPDLPTAVSATPRSREGAREHAARLRREQEGRGWSA